MRLLLLPDFAGLQTELGKKVVWDDHLGEFAFAVISCRTHPGWLDFALHRKLKEMREKMVP